MHREVIVFPSKKCTKCLETKQLVDFYKNGDRADGRYSQCRICTRELDRERRKRNTSTIAGYFKHAISRIKARSKKKNLEFNVTIDDLLELYIKQQGLCAITKVRMNHNIGNGRPPNRVSVDRIDNKKGYLKNNIQLVSDAVNTMKGTLTIKELRNYCELILQNTQD